MRKHGLITPAGLTRSTPADPPEKTPGSEIASILTWHRADLGIQLSPSLGVSGWADQVGDADGISNVTLEQAGLLYDPTILQNKAVIDFDGDVLNKQHLRFGNASSFNHLHDGTGGALWVAFQLPPGSSEGNLLVNNYNTSASVGIFLYKISTGVMEIGISNGTGFVYFNSGGLTLVDEARHTLMVAYETAHSPQIQVWLDGASILTGSESNSPTVSNASFTMFMNMRNQSPNNWLNAEVAEWFTMGSFPSEDEINFLSIYGARYGI